MRPPTLKGPAMTIKEKFTAAKEKIKPYAPEIIVAVSVIVPAAIGIVAVKKQLSSSLLEPMTPVDDATRDLLLKNKDFLLYQLSDTEYILDSQVPLV